MFNQAVGVDTLPPVSEEFKVASLGAIVEVGKEKMAELSGLTLAAVNRETAALASSVSPEALTRSNYFAFSMRMAICGVALECAKAKAGDWGEKFRARLESIFPSGLAKLLYSRAVVEMRDAVARSGNPVPSKEEMNKHEAERESILRRQRDAERFLSAYKQRPISRNTAR